MRVAPSLLRQLTATARVWPTSAHLASSSFQQKARIFFNEKKNSFLISPKELNAESAAIFCFIQFLFCKSSLWLQIISTPCTNMNNIFSLGIQNVSLLTLRLRTYNKLFVKANTPIIKLHNFDSRWRAEC